jgi:PGF-CTERM protein
MRVLAVTALLMVAAVAGVAAPSGAAVGQQASDAPDACTNVAFYDLPERPPPVTIGYTADENTSVFFVLSVDGEVVGHTDLQEFDRAVAVDGQDVPLDENRSGSHELTVTPHVDSDDDGEFDPETDESCGSEYGATQTQFFPNQTDAFSGSLTPADDDAGVLTTHRATYEFSDEVPVRAVAIDYLQAPTTNRRVLRNTSEVDVSASVVHADGTEESRAVTASARNGLLVATLADPVATEPGSTVRLAVDGVPNPRRNASVPLVVNPESSALARDAELTVHDGPVHGLAMFTTSSPSPPPLRVGFSVSERTQVGFLATANHEVIGTSDFTSAGANTAIDGFEVPVDADLTGDHRVTVYAVRDSNGNGEVDSSDRPYVRDGNYVRTSRVLSFGGDRGTLTAEYAPSEATSVSGVSVNLPAVGVGTESIGDESVSVRAVNASGQRDLKTSIVLSRGGEYVISLRDTTEIRDDETLVVTVDDVAAADRIHDLALSLNPNRDARTVDASFSFEPATGTGTEDPVSEPTVNSPAGTDTTRRTSDADSPGFGAVAALAALAGAGLLARRR